jgi:hypothetical protein
MEKQIKTDEIFRSEMRGEYADWRMKDITIETRQDDIIHIERDPGYYSENNSWDPFSVLVIMREREETDEEFEERKLSSEKRKEDSKKLRYETYLKLKKEFEGNEPI